MSPLAFLSTPMLERASGFLARMGIWMGRQAIADELWRREELDRAVAEAREHFLQ